MWNLLSPCCVFPCRGTSMHVTLLASFWSCAQNSARRNCLLGKFGSRKWAYVHPPPVYFSFGIQPPPEAHILPCSSIRYVFLERHTTWGGRHFSTTAQDQVQVRLILVSRSLFCLKPKLSSPILSLPFCSPPARVLYYFKCFRTGWRLQEGGDGYSSETCSNRNIFCHQAFNK